LLQRTHTSIFVLHLLSVPENAAPDFLA